MKISVVTPSYNQGSFIEETIRSVMHQDHGEVEHIVVDGGSTDNTVEILRKYAHLRWVSEKDSGQSNAINKGFRMASGGILAWLNSDDMYEDNVLGAVAGYFDDHPECMLAYGDVTFVDRAGKRMFAITGGTMDYESLLENPDRVRQPSCFWRSDLVREVGELDERLHLAMDFDFLVRAGACHRFHYLARSLSLFRCYDENKSLSLQRRQVRELVRVYRKNNVRLTAHTAGILARKYAKSFPGVDRLARLMRTPHGAPG